MCCGSVGTAIFPQSRGCVLQVLSCFLRISLEDTTSLMLCRNNRRTRVTMRHCLTESFGCLSMPLPLSWRAFPHSLSPVSFWTEQCHDRTNDFLVKLAVNLSLHSQWHQAGRGRAANGLIGAWTPQSLHYVIFSRSTSFCCHWDPGKHVGGGPLDGNTLTNELGTEMSKKLFTFNLRYQTCWDIGRIGMARHTLHNSSSQPFE